MTQEIQLLKRHLHGAYVTPSGKGCIIARVYRDYIPEVTADAVDAEMRKLGWTPDAHQLHKEEDDDRYTYPQLQFIRE